MTESQQIGISAKSQRSFWGGRGVSSEGGSPGGVRLRVSSTAVGAAMHCRGGTGAESGVLATRLREAGPAQSSVSIRRVRLWPDCTAMGAVARGSVGGADGGARGSSATRSRCEGSEDGSRSCGSHPKSLRVGCGAAERRLAAAARANNLPLDSKLAADFANTGPPGGAMGRR